MTTTTPLQVAPALHPMPAPGAVMREELGTVGRAARTEIITFVGLLVAVIAITLITALRMNAHNQSGFEFGPRAMIPVSIVALLFPFAVWRGDDRERRMYFWAMPVSTSSHTLTKYAAGLVWMMGGVAAYLLMLVILPFIASIATHATPYFNTEAWYWVTPFIGAAIAYTLTSIAVIGSRSPWRWVAGVPLVFLLLQLLAKILGVPQLGDYPRILWDAYAGLDAAIFGGVRMMDDWVGHGDPDATRWLIASAVWAVVTVAGVVLASRRDPDV